MTTSENVNFTVTIPTSVLGAALLCIGKKDSRPVCNSVHFFDNSIVGTDGRLLLKAVIATQFPHEFRLPYDEALRIYRMAKKSQSFELDVCIAKGEITGDWCSFFFEARFSSGETVKVTVKEFKYSAKAPIRDSFSSPLDFNIDDGWLPTLVNPELVAIAGKVGKTLESTAAEIRTRGDSATHIRYRGARDVSEATFLLMPVADDKFYREARAIKEKGR